MKILITGYTTRQFGSDRIHGDYKTFSFLLHDILLSMGHTVDRRKTLVNEKLWEQYDFAFLGVAPINSMTSGRVCETHYAMEAMRGRHCIYADDWSFCDFGGSVRYVTDTDEKWDKFTKYKKWDKLYTKDILDSVKTHLLQMMSLDEDQNAPVLAPMFPWGNHNFLMIGTERNPNYKAKLNTIDPSKWLQFPNIDIPTPLEKKREWLMAALSDHTPWIKKQGFRFPVGYIGNKRMLNCPVLCERDTVATFATYFGVLATGYPSAGSGWWRTRYLNAAWAESIVYCDSRDQVTMGLAYQGTPQLFESITSERGYLDIVESQNAWLQANISEKEVVLTLLERMMKK